ncbi:MAG: caspase family protein [Pirellulaceae bacterium]
MATKKALLVGINNYQHVSDLRGCVSDVEKYKSLLADAFDFPRAGLHTLIDEEAVKAKLKTEWDWLLKGAKPGDQLVFMMAGHGSQTADQGDDEPDGVDELLCLYDMDFDDPGSYLLDDELHRLAKRLPEGVSLTIVLDCCHTGTATRMLFAPTAARDVSPQKAPLVALDTALARAADRAIAGPLSLRGEGVATIESLLQPRTEEQQRRTVLARYILPPPKVLELMHRVGVRRGFKKARSAGKRSMNHVLFAASDSHQTSADAYIDNGYHGAFSYYFCRAVLAAGVDADQQQLLRDVRAALAEGRFDQVPQLEPETTAGPLFGRKKPASGASKPALSPAPATTQPQPASGEIESEVGHKILAVLAQILEQLQQRPVAAAEARAGGERALVYVHGICPHEPGYSSGWWQALRPHLPAVLRARLDSHRHEVLWSEFVTPTRALPRDLVSSATARAYERREEDLAEYLKDVVADRAHREALAELPAQDRDLAPVAAEVAFDRGAVERAGLNCLDDFAKYLLDGTIRRDVQKAFLDVVLPLLESGQSVDLMGHSWGTVVAYEALRTLDRRDLPGHVRNLFTIGSALAIVPIQRRLETGDYAKPRHVRRWINLDARRDYIGGALASLGYGVDAEYLNLAAVGCGLFLTNPACPHNSYFHAQNTAVNRDIFAAQMQQG